jgi:hypothetical protein
MEFEELKEFKRDVKFLLNSGLRLIYAHFKEEQRIVFIEIYHKVDKEGEDRDRILENFE